MTVPGWRRHPPIPGQGPPPRAAPPGRGWHEPFFLLTLSAAGFGAILLLGAVLLFGAGLVPPEVPMF